MISERDNALDLLRTAQIQIIGHCPVCGEDRWEYYGGREHFGLRIEYWICCRCCFVAQSPRLTDDALGEFYSKYYRLVWHGSASPVEEELALQRERGRNLLSILFEAFRMSDAGTILDYGCSSGELLDVARNEFKAQALFGIELDLVYGELARQRGIQVYRTHDQAERAISERLDAITISHVLEHVPDPRDTLLSCGRMLKKGAKIAIEVPHSCEGGCFQVVHLWGFNESSLERLLVDTGFRVCLMTTHGLPRTPGNTNINLVAIAERREGSSSTALERPSSAWREKSRRYLARHPGQSRQDYLRYRLLNTIRQAVGRIDDQFIAHSFFPTRLARQRSR